MSTWLQMSLGDFVTLQRGHDLPTQSRRPGPIPIMGSFGITGYHNVARADGPGVTIGRSGASFGVVSYSSEPFWPLNTALYVVDFHGNDERFAYYFLKQFDFTRYNSGSAQPSLNRNFIHPIPVQVPPLEEQRHIAHILGTLDDKIELNRRMNRTLEAIARAIFKSWFVDFDPVHTKAEDRRPVGMDPETASLFPDSFQGSPLGKIPKGWETGSILEQADLLSGGTPKTSREDYWGGGVQWASAKDVSQCGEVFLLQTERTITNLGLEESATQLIPALSAAVVARGATTGRMVLFGSDMAMNQTCYALVSKNATPFSLYCQFRFRVDEMVHAAHGSVFDTITTSTFRNVPFVLPPLSLLKAFEEVIVRPFCQILTATRESRVLAALRDELLPRLLSGDLPSNAGLGVARSKRGGR